MRIMPSPERRIRRCPFCAAVSVLAASWSSGLAAQTIAVDSINPIQSDLGVLVSAASGDTIFRLDPSDGFVTKKSGQGSRQGGGMARALVTLSCTGETDCDTETIVTIAATGSTGRAGSLTAFAIAPGPNPPTIGATEGSDILTFTVTDIPANGTRDFYLGADFTLLHSGDTGAAGADFTVSVPGSAKSGGIVATTLRPLAISNVADLAFGRIIPPTGGSATVILNAVNGLRSVTGGSALPTPPPSLAEFQVNGEGGQNFSIDVPESFSLTGPGGSLTVTTNDNADSTPVLDGSAGGEGTYSFQVGGSFEMSDTTPAGLYSGSFIVSVLYN